MIGLSGLITPSLDEMVHVAREMQRLEMTTPLLIGGATTSAKHTAVKIAPHYKAGVTHVLDASRSVGVVEKLLNPDNRKKFEEENRKLQAELVASYSKRQSVKLVPYAEALAKRFATDWATVDIPTPTVHGDADARRFPPRNAPRVHRLVPLLPDLGTQGEVPPHLRRPEAGRRGEEAVRRRPGAARPRSSTKSCSPPTASTASGRRTPTGTTSSSTRTTPAPPRRAASTPCGNSGSARGRRRSTRWPTSSPRSTRAAQDYIGGFAVTAGIGCDELAARFDADHDDYNSIMVKALADRLAEAFAECLHAQARRDWGYGEEEGLSNDDLIAEKYRGIRPAAGYPAQPDHTEKRTLFDLLGRDGGDRHQADRELRHAPGRQRQRALLRPPREPLLRRRPAQQGPGGRLRPPQGDAPGAKWSGGCRRIWVMNRVDRHGIIQQQDNPTKKEASHGNADSRPLHSR